MHELAGILREFTPTSYGLVWVAIMFTIYLIREWRETRKMSSEDKLARRDGYARQVELLMNENRHLLEDQHKLRIEYDQHRRQCYEETERLRMMIVRLEHEVRTMQHATPHP